MAQIVRTIIDLVDDMDGSEGQHTIEFSWGGEDFIIDLNSANAAHFENAIRPFLNAARPRPKPKRKQKAKSKAVATEQEPVHRSHVSAEKQLRDEMREWGRANGFEVSNMSRVPKDVVTAYRQAHGRSE